MPYEIVFFDIDFTLINSEKEIPQDTMEAIRKLKENGTQVAIATGRPPYMFKEIAKKLEIDTFVCINGSLVIHQGQIIRRHIFEKADLAKLEEQASKHGHALSYFALEGSFANQDHHPRILECFEDLRFPSPAYEPNAWREYDMYQALVYCTEEEAHLYQSLDAFRFVRWHEFSMDGIPLGSSKAKGIEVLLDHLGLDRSQAVAFGDGLNDLEMLSYVGMGVAMGNAHEELKAQANYITKSVDQGGVAFGLAHLGLIK
ncbi:Cof-type HAD-IIB family hydrolase [Ammoniphilus sp. CFH 90114]|uniref:Cof-type HAD-IIB family hydrolase n=1 Tax=Ammoniphilus sp. CFH 90114 TaxID=2493665 RepID=UPI00100EA472|nr:Cof-type HAD-IIB family hydrolase [Ammoniphilus sp. CFH 90114]RXT03799.1 Cof-type HAD-IIB family hydrolase [Ammoniphilus sp. CFH 90114]